MKRLLLYILRPFLIPHIILYVLSRSRRDIDKDISTMRKKQGVNYGTTLSLTYLLCRNRYYRNVFYRRIGRLSALVSWYLPKDKTFFPCPNIGGGIYCAHPYATILNAKSIGENFSVRQCTTLGNKRDGDNDERPTIGDNVTLGANVVIIGDVHIGNNAIIGAGSVVVHDVPANTVVAGNPARIIRRIDN